jgi:NADPH:quinone reductase-like Zn-dependent oxidoreductase
MPKVYGFAAYGGSDEQDFWDQPKPEPGPADLLIAVHAAAVNPVDWKIREGYLKDGLALDLPAVLGQEAAGVVEAVRRGEISAVFAETDLGAAAVFHALHAAGLSVPGDVSLVGFDDILGAEYIAGGLTTVYHPAAEMAAEGVAVLLGRLTGDPARQTLLPTHLTVRHSTRRYGH